jgi:superfamily I DNA/RNA helicase
LPHTAEELEAAAVRRAETTDRIIASAADRRLIIAGPGTGKTHNFKLALQDAGGGGLALTFIRALVRDLERDLGDLAQVNTFHGFCKHLAHKLALEGLTSAFDYYPPLVMLMAEDEGFLGRDDVRQRDLERALHELDDSARLISDELALGSYYNAVFHDDVVYRVLRHLEGDGDSVPEFPLIVVDEYQDFCRIETELIRVLETKNRVLAAGDDDQALYGFKDASPEFIRGLAAGSEYERFDLPYCSRCTEVVVRAVNNVVRNAQERGALEGRVDREYLCYLPEKLDDSEAHPEIVWAECSVHMKKAPYMGMYVAQQIASIPAEDIAASHAGKYPTALVVGRRHHVEAAYSAIRDAYPNAILRTSSTLEIDALDGYRRLARDARSRLGWRIILHEFPIPNGGELIAEVLRSDSDVVDLLPDEYRERHLGLAESIRVLLDGEGATTAQLEGIERGLDRPIDEVMTALGRDEEGDVAPPAEPEEGVPTVVCTTLLGAKGLSAGYVFMLGFNNGAFPADPAAITDDEICKLIVGLSRTRKECHLVSCRMFGGPPWVEPSAFLGWLDVPIRKVEVSKTYWS